MRKTLTMLAAIAALTACSSTAQETDSGGAAESSTPAGEARPGDPAVYQRIDGATDCAGLQQEFDTASDSHDRADAGSDQAEWAVAYMQAADARMKELDCY